MTADLSEPNSRNPQCVLILAGTTASGKTDVSIPLAEILKGEIVNADSRQIYRELHIGTAKPSPKQLAHVPHHFIDEKSITERWTAGDFARAARDQIALIFERNSIPILVGGSMLYIKALTDGFYEMDELDSSDYYALRQEAEQTGWETLYAELQERDPELAAQTDPHDGHRILRGLAVSRNRQQRLSDLQQQPRAAMPWPFRLYFLHGDRQQTYERVNRRVIEMIEAGLVEEVRGLANQGFDEHNCNALRTHGYQEVFPYLRGEISQDEMIEKIQQAVRHYVKRQMTWFRHDERAIWIHRDFQTPPESIAEQIAADFRASI
ncbi:MAG: tRNA (adenosine(37)-N6)-dimethylallyltransferase MiaA [Calditrichota bacterium]